MTRARADSATPLSGRSFWFAALAAVGGVLVLVAASALYSTVRQSEAEFELVTEEVPATIAALERSIGYGGFIHNFKNHVLRTDEERYGVAARANYDEARGYISDLEAMAARQDIPLDTADLLATLDAYASKLDDVDRLYAAGATIGQIDAAVRLPDDDAIADLAALHQTLNTALNNELEANRLRITALASGLIAAFVIGIALVAGLILSAQRTKLRDAMRIASLDERLNAILLTARNGILGLGPDGSIRVANPGARDLLGTDAFGADSDWPDRVPLRRTEDLTVYSRDAHPLWRAVAGEALRGEVAIMGDGEEARYLRVTSARVAPRTTDDVQTVVTLDDVTEIERGRQQFERAARLDALGQLTGGIAHDFNNLLGTIEYAVELARDETPGADNRFLDTARNAVRRGAELTQRLLTFARRQPTLVQPVPVARALENLSALARPVVDASIEVSITPPAEGLHVLCDEAQLENALLNLTLNGRDAIRDSGQGNRIEIRARVIDGMTRRQLGENRPDADQDVITEFVEISVSDNGPGMTPEVRRRATDPFFTTKPQGEGTGLGLSMVYGFVEHAGGLLKIYSDVGRGTTIRMFLPRGRPDQQSAAEPPPPILPTGTGQRILLVDDQPDLLALTRDVLAGLGYSVLTACSGSEALDHVSSGESCDLLLTDVVMPGMSGFELAVALRAISPDLPVIYMSGYTEISEAQMGPVVAPILQKPCPPAELAAVLRDALAGTPQS
ncbi:response regulator [Maritimibacter sp. UBA3975]|uniref:hybrid sensor histidine kinase/response regulator n=1 Tax=Maritimibacter sp. UBA3975 TaxID=1946833 RepID=UPI0025C51DA9|nr:response regulator [Maritimibacter sp. UBA3975]